MYAPYLFCVRMGVTVLKIKSPSLPPFLSTGAKIPESLTPSLLHPCTCTPSNSTLPLPNKTLRASSSPSFILRILSKKQKKKSGLLLLFILSSLRSSFSARMKFHSSTIESTYLLLGLIRILSSPHHRLTIPSTPTSPLLNASLPDDDNMHCRDALVAAVYGGKRRAGLVICSLSIFRWVNSTSEPDSPHSSPFPLFIVCSKLHRPYIPIKFHFYCSERRCVRRIKRPLSFFLEISTLPSRFHRANTFSISRLKLR